MTRKDYVAIAEAIAPTVRHGLSGTIEDRSYAEGHLAAAGSIRGAIADVLAKDNPRFDRQRFYNACEGIE